VPPERRSAVIEACGHLEASRLGAESRPLSLRSRGRRRESNAAQ
jgi:hypothetical protein